MLVAVFSPVVMTVPARAMPEICERNYVETLDNIPQVHMPYHQETQELASYCEPVFKPWQKPERRVFRHKIRH